MPLHDFECKDCGGIEEGLVRISGGDRNPLCGKCGGKTRRLFGLPARPQFKGAGFYETDYKRIDDRTAELDPTAPSIDQD